MNEGIGIRLFFTALVMSAFLSACGGGGGSGESSAQPNDGPGPDTGEVSHPSNPVALDTSNMKSLHQQRQVINFQELNNDLVFLHTRLEWNTYLRDQIRVLDRNNGGVSFNLDFNEWIHLAFIDENRLFVISDNGLSVYAFNATFFRQPILVETLDFYEAAGVISPGYVKYTVDRTRNTIFAKYNSGIFAVSYDLAGSPTLHGEIYSNSILDNGSIDLVIDENKGSLYFAWDDLVELHYGDIGPAIQYEVSYPIDGYSFRDSNSVFQVIHGGTVIWKFVDYKLNTYRIEADDSVSLVESISMDLYSRGTWDPFLRSTNDGKTLVLWQEETDPGELLIGKNLYFEVHEDGTVSDISAARCVDSDGFASYRNVYIGDVTGDFIGTGPALINYKYSSGNLSCERVGYIDGEVGFQAVQDVAVGGENEIGYSFDIDTQRISVVVNNGLDLTVLQSYLVDDHKQSWGKHVMQLSPDRRNLYLISTKKVYIFDVDIDGTISVKAVHDNPENKYNNGPIVFSKDGSYLFIGGELIIFYSFYFDIVPLLAVFEVNSEDGSISHLYDYQMVDAIYNDPRISNPIVLGISDSGESLYAVNRFFGLMYIFDVNDPRNITVDNYYVDPYTALAIYDGAVSEEHRLEGLTQVNGIAFSRDGSALFLPLGETSYSGEPLVDASMLVVGIDESSGAHTLKQSIEKSRNHADISLSGALFYDSPVICNDKLIVTRTDGSLGDAVDIFEIKSDQTLSFIERYSESYFGFGISKALLWGADNALLGFNKLEKALISVPIRCGES